MSKIGDELFGRLLRQLAGVEPMTQPGRQCFRCKKDMSNYAVLFETKPTDICSECDLEIRRERAIERWKTASPPTYDIDAVIGPPGRKAYQIVSDLYRVFYELPCPETILYEAEVVIRDFCEFDQLSGHDLGYILGLNQGDTILLRGHRAFMAIGASKMERYIAEFLKAAACHGVTFPNPLPDPWLDHIRIDRELEKVLDNESCRLCDEIDPYEGRPAGYFCELLIDYVMKHIDLLRQRKPKSGNESSAQ